MIRDISSRFKDAICVLVLALLIVIVFWPALFQGRLLLPTDQFDTMTLPFSSNYGPPQAYNHNLTDAMMQSYPWKVQAQKAFRNGEFYYWNPLILNGYPQYAASSQTYDVFNVLLLPFDLPYAFNLILVFELFTAGAGMFILLRVHRRRRIIALMFATAWMFNGMFLTHLLNSWALATFCWVPFALAMSLEYYRKHSTHYLLAAGFFLGLALLGSNLQSAAYAVVSFVIVTGAWSLKAKGSLSRKIFMHLGVPCAVALTLSAIMWLPATELFLESVRHGTLYSPTHGHPYSLIDRVLSFVLLSTFFIPELMGIVRSVSLTSIAGVHPLDFSGYLGFTEMLMGVWAVLSFRSSEESVRPYVWLVAAGFLLPIFTPLFAWLYHRFFIVGTLGLTVLGAERLEAFLTNTDLKQRGHTLAKWVLWIGLAAFGLLLIANLVWTLSPSVHSAIESFLLRHTSGTAYADGNAAWVHDRIAGTFEHYSVLSPMMLIPFGVVFGVCVLVLKWDRWSFTASRYFVLTLLACSIIQTVFWWRSFLPMLDPHTFPLVPKNRSITFLKDRLDGSRAFIDRRAYPGHQYLFLDNLPWLYDIPQITGYESVVPRSFYPQVKQIFPNAPHPKALGLMGVKYLMFVPGVVPRGTLPVADSGAVTIYDDTFVRPRATIYYRSQTVPDDSAVLRQMFDENNRHEEVLFTDGSEHPQMLSDSSVSSSAWEAARIVKEDDNSLDIAARPSRDAYLVLSDTYYPGWKCFVDGKEQSIYRANYAMRGIFLSAGLRHITFRFDPLSFRVGSTISMISLFSTICGALIMNLRFRKSRR